MAATDYIPLNFALLANPLNWVIIVLMVMIAGIAAHLIFHPNNFLAPSESAQ